MTISRYHKLFVLSALICAIPVSDAHSGPIATKLWGIASSYFSSTTRLPQNPFGTGVNSNHQSYFDNFTSVSTDSNASSAKDLGWFSTKTLLVGAAVVAAGGYALYKCYSSYKQRQAEREEREAREEAERQAKLVRQAERKAADLEIEQLLEASRQRKEQLQAEREAVGKNNMIKEVLRKRLVAQQKSDLIPRRKINKEQQASQREKRLRLRESKLKRAAIDEAFVHYDEKSTLSERVKNCSLCNQLTVNYLNNLYKDKDREHKDHVIGFLRGVTALGVEKSGWSKRNIMPLINNGGTSFVIDRLEYIAKGEQLVAQITSGKIDHNTPQNQQEYLDSLISITWYFYAKALQKGDGFSKSASFNIQSKALMNFFMGYYHQVREWHANFDSSPRAVVGSRVGLGDNPFAYERVSSHLKELKKTNYGFDIRFATESDDVADSQALLPDDKAHLLFMPYDEQAGRFLLKPEACGTSAFDITETVEHGLEFLHGSKDNDYDYTRREKTKKDIRFAELVSRYQALVPGQEIGSSVRDIEMIRVYGIQYMLQRLDHWITKSQEPRLEKLTKLKQDIITSYTDNHDIRFAHEVVFKESDFR